ncbi:MAG: hypothetical protein ABI533_00635 [Betaproteobacteria bacterium]
MTGFALLAGLALVACIVVAYRAGAASARGGAPAAVTPPVPTARAIEHALPDTAANAGGAATAPHPELAQLTALAEDRRRLFGAIADVRAETARYRQIVIDIERDAPPPLLDAPGTPDDLKLIVGVGPVIERMLYQLGIASYRQIARWTERDIDDFDARLREFPGRIRRDGWVTQARSLHLAKYGDAP